MSDNSSARAQKLGDLIKSARTWVGRSTSECAAVLALSEKEFEQAEKGRHMLSLPELEALAIYLGVPMGHFWGNETLEDVLSQVEYHKMIDLRHRVIGVLLRQLRLQERRTQKELGEALGVDGKIVKQYEGGQPIPYLHLEELSRQLGVTTEYFVDDQRGPLGKHEAEQQLRRQFRRLSPELQAFLLNPVNASYLETAWRLSKMDVEKLRQIAESLLDITL